MTEPARAYWNDRLTEAWGLHGVGSLAYGRHYNAWLYRVRRRAFADVCRRLDVDVGAADVLDVGCGTGFYLDLWQARGVRSVSGLDFSAIAIERLKQQYPEMDLREADIADPLPPMDVAEFDVVSAFDVLFHLVDDARYAAALTNIASVLRPGGTLIYSDNFLRGPSKQYEQYWKTRSRGEAERALDEAGFEIVRCDPVFVLMNSPVDGQSRLWQRLWDLAMRVVQKSETLGYLAGAALYPAEAILRKWVRPGPSTKIMVCRKRP